MIVRVKKNFNAYAALSMEMLGGLENKWKEKLHKRASGKYTSPAECVV